MSKEEDLKEEKSNELYTLLCKGREYKTRFKVGDRVEMKGYINVVILDGVDEFLTNALNELHWKSTDEDYILGKRKTTNAEPCSDKDIEPCT